MSSGQKNPFLVERCRNCSGPYLPSCYASYHESYKVTDEEAWEKELERREQSENCWQCEVNPKAVGGLRCEECFNGEMFYKYQAGSNMALLDDEADFTGPSPVDPVGDVRQRASDIKSASGKLFYTTNRRRKLDSEIEWERPLARFGPQQFWVDVPELGECGHPMCYDFCTFCTVYPTRRSMSDYEYAHKYGISVEEWRESVAYHHTKILFEQEPEGFTASQAAAFAKVDELTEQVRLIRQARDNDFGASAKGLLSYREQLEELESELLNIRKSLDLVPVVEKEIPVGKFDCSWLNLNEDRNQWVNRLVDESDMWKSLPESEMGCPWILVKLTPEAWVSFLRVRGYGPSVVTGNPAKSGKREQAAEDHKIAYAKANRDALLDVTAPYVYETEEQTKQRKKLQGKIYG